MRLFKRFWLSRHEPLNRRSPLLQGGAPSYRARGRFAGVCECRGELESGRDGKAEVLWCWVRQQKTPIYGDFLTLKAL
jgi:hypothetical protein